MAWPRHLQSLGPPRRHRTMTSTSLAVPCIKPYWSPTTHKIKYDRHVASARQGRGHSINHTTTVAGYRARTHHPHSWNRRSRYPDADFPSRVGPHSPSRARPHSPSRARLHSPCRSGPALSVVRRPPPRSILPTARHISLILPTTPAIPAGQRLNVTEWSTRPEVASAPYQLGQGTAGVTGNCVPALCPQSSVWDRV
jgi:hypothetical protein